MFDQFIESLLYLVLGFSIKCTGRFIKENDLRAAHKSPGNSHALLLAAREAHTTLSNLCVEALREQLSVLDKG